SSIPFFFFSSRRRHTRSKRDWSSDVCSSDLLTLLLPNTSQSIYAYVSRLLDSSGLHFSTTQTVANMEIAVQSASAGLGVCFTLEIGRASCRERVSMSAGAVVRTSRQVKAE